MHPLDQLYDIGRYIDTKALGFSARVSQATHWATGQDVAFKVLRREHARDDRVWAQFAAEVELLELFRRTGTINHMIDCGYVSDQSHERPVEGEIASHGRDVDGFRQDMAVRWAHGWRPYIALELLPAEHCLLNLIHSADGEGQPPLRLPTEEGLTLAMQCAKFLAYAHALDVVYWDHKPEHAYWDGQRLRIIDLNVSRRLNADLGAEECAAEKRKDVRYLILGVLYTAFTGHDFRFQDQAPQASPSAPDALEMRFNGITHLDFGMEDTLLPALPELVNYFVSSSSVDLTAYALLDGLRKAAALIGWEAGYAASEEARAARDEIQQGLAALRQAQAGIVKAREHFLRARTLNPADRESERLYHGASEFYQRRVLP